MLYLILLFKYCFFEHLRKWWNSKRNSGQHEIPWAEKKVWEVREKQKKKKKEKKWGYLSFCLIYIIKNVIYVLGRKA